MTNLLNQMFCSCNDCFICDQQEDDAFDNLVEELQPLIEMRDSLNVKNLIEEGKPEDGEEEFSRESRKIRLGMMRSCMVKTMQYSYDFQRNGKTKYGFPAERKRLEKKKPFQFARC